MEEAARIADTAVQEAVEKDLGWCPDDCQCEDHY
jgi:hypothetical protein